MHSTPSFHKYSNELHIFNLIMPWDFVVQLFPICSSTIGV